MQESYTADDEVSTVVQTELNSINVPTCDHIPILSVSASCTLKKEIESGDGNVRWCELTRTILPSLLLH